MSVEAIIATQVIDTTSIGRSVMTAADAAAIRTAITAQETLVSATNIKTINSTSLLGSGDITVSADLSGHVPYTGASGAVNLGSYGLTCGAIITRNGTTPTSIQVTNTYTSATSYETINIKGKAAANFEIGPENGSAGGTLRGLTIGGYTAGSTTITPWLTFDPSGLLVTVASTYTLVLNTLQVNSGGQIRCVSGNITFADHATATTFNLLRFGGTSSSYPAIKRNAAALNFRLADDSDYAAITTGAITASGTVTGRASTTAAATAPIKLATGVLMTTPEAGAIEYDGTNLYFTDSGGTRRQLQVV